MKINFVTSNNGKFKWAKRRLSKYDIELVRKSLEIEESRSIDVEDVALDKAKKIKKEIKDPFIVEDTSFCIPVLNKFPSTQIKFVSKTIGIQGILKLLEGQENRDACFKSSLVFSKRDSLKIFTCEDWGTIPKKPHGNNTRNFSELLKIFVPKEYNKTLAEMSDSEFKNYERKIEENDHYIKFANFIKQNGT